MAKPKKKSHGKKKSSKRATKGAQHDVVVDARAQPDPLSSLPPSFLEVPLSRPPLGTAAEGPTPSDDAGATPTAIVRHFSSPLPAGLLRQCLELFQTNMGEMYRQSKWGLDVEEKRKELQHADARFLVVLAAAAPAAITTSTTATATADGASTEAADAARSSHGDTATIDDHENDTVLGFAHLRYERDDDGLLPVAYLYELQVSPAVQKLGLGKKLMTLVELLALRTRMTKVLLTVFHHNAGALGFYRKNGYAVDESSPSNFAGEEGAACDYEILSKAFA